MLRQPWDALGLGGRRRTAREVGESVEAVNRARGRPVIAQTDGRNRRSKTESLSGYRVAVVVASAAVIDAVEQVMAMTCLRAPHMPSTY